MLRIITDAEPDLSDVYFEKMKGKLKHTGDRAGNAQPTVQLPVTFTGI